MATAGGWQIVLSRVGTLHKSHCHRQARHKGSEQPGFGTIMRHAHSSEESVQNKLAALLSKNMRNHISRERDRSQASWLCMRCLLICKTNMRHISMELKGETIEAVRLQNASTEC